MNIKNNIDTYNNNQGSGNNCLLYTSDTADE